MGKIIKFPQRQQKYNYDLLEYLELIGEIHDLELNIELANGYNENYKEYKSEEEYQSCLREIEKTQKKLDELKIKLSEIESII